MPETVPVPRSGLLSLDDVPVPLAGVSIDAEINNFCAQVTVTQRFVNREARPIEAVYMFPLEEGAAVSGFQAIIDGTLVVGEVKEREQAFRQYDEAMEAGHGAFLLDEERPDVFQASVGNLLPGKEVLLKLTYVTELTIDGGGIRFAIPTTVSPRYAPAQDRVGVGRPDSETLNPPVSWQVPYGLDLKIGLTMAGAIHRIESPSHPVAVAQDGTNATVTLSQRETALDRDFVLTVEAGALDTPQACVEKEDDGAYAVAVAFAPRLPDTATPAEVMFVVDRSGSMEGTSIQEVRNALQLCLRSMVPGCRFNIIGFGSNVDALFPESREYTEASLREATAHVSALQANLGGTELLPALEFAFSSPAHGTLARQVVILTDGEVTNTDAVLLLARTQAARARIFTVGIGPGASHHLIKGVARAANGAAEFIFPGERIEPKVIRMFGRLLSPALTNLRVDWGGLGVTQVPSTVPVIFGGGRLLLYGVLRSAPRDWAGAVRITADAATGPLVLETRIDPRGIKPGRTVATLAARARIRELEESPEWTTARGSRQRERKTPAATQEIIALAVRYGLISRETSYVAIERRDTPVVGDVQLRRVPIALTTGWGGGRRHLFGSRDMMPATSAASAPRFLDLGSRAQASSRAWSSPHAAQATWSMLTSVPRRSRPHERGAAGAGRTPAASSAMVALVTLQRADGSWELTEPFAAAIGRTLHDLERVLGADAKLADARTAWATSLAIAWLQHNATAAADEWRLLVLKARGWLAAATVSTPDGVSWSEAADRFITHARPA